MLQNYSEVTHVDLEDMKNYVEEISGHYERCLTRGQFMRRFKRHYEEYFQDAMKALIEARGFADMEHHLVMLNYFFAGDERLYVVKKKIKKIMLALDQPIQAYQILRHVMDLDILTLIESLRLQGYMNTEQAAYCMLVEGAVDEAYDYLMSFDHVPSQALLDYFHAYSMKGYYSLMRHYASHHLELSFG